MTKAIIKFLDGGYCNLAADRIDSDKDYDIFEAQACKNEVNGDFYIALNLYNKDVVFRI